MDTARITAGFAGLAAVTLVLLFVQLQFDAALLLGA
jgi:hypothetical protein